MSKCVFIKHSVVAETLASNPQKGKRALEPLKSLTAKENMPGAILEDVEVMNDAEVHVNEGDFCICLEGKMKFTYGGELVEPWFNKNPDGSVNESELRAKSISGGIEAVLESGDVLWIPPGEPHQHGCEGVARMALIKIPQK